MSSRSGGRRSAPSLRRVSCALSLALVSSLAASAQAAPAHVLRFATIAPDGTEWARLSRSFAREIEQETHGSVQVKWYFGGIAGDEKEMIARIRRGQLDGVASGGMTCQRLAPTMKVIRIVGLFQSREEALYVLGRLKPRLDREFAAGGFTNLGEAGFGSDIVFSRTPVRTLDDLRRARLWVWDVDDVYNAELPALGLHATPLPIDQALPAFDAGKIDGFISVAMAALAYQWSTRAHYFTELRVGYLMGCMVVAQTAFDPLSGEEQQAVHGAAARLMRHMEDMGESQDAALLGSLFEKQGMYRVEVSKSFRVEFLDAARAARLKLGTSLTSQALLDEINGWLADYRSDHQ
ncbi:MAG: TRAP-type C4-dicarboxylate transport system, substrate-binding protein [bacterium]|nr:TRAP-type C4-dicarboxylate transport system, substrate-binding protein [bacterium]